MSNFWGCFLCFQGQKNVKFLLKTVAWNEVKKTIFISKNLKKYISLTFYRLRNIFNCVLLLDTSPWDLSIITLVVIVFRLCLKTSLPHHTSRFLALNEWFFAFATNGDIQFGDKFRPQCTFVARTSIHYTLTLKALFVQKLVIGIWVIAIKWLLIFWQSKNLLNSCNKGN